MIYEDLKSHLDSLTTSEKSELFEYLKFIITFGTEHQTEYKLLNFDHSTTTCPRCHSNHINKNGHFRGKQRYVCCECGSSFNDFTDTFLYHNKVPIEKWILYGRLFIECKSLPTIAKELQITIVTAFYMRHKLLDAISSNIDSVLKEIIEADETFLAVSYKGQSKLPRISRKRGKQTKMRGLSHEKVCIAVALDNDKNLLIKPICLGRVQTNGLFSMFANHIEEGSILCTDRASAYMEVASKLKLIHHRYRNKSEFDQYHINHINSLHNNFKMWINGFRGVSTKYLEHYTSWFGLLHFMKNMDELSKVRTLMKKIMEVHVYKTHKQLTSIIPIFL